MGSHPGEYEETPLLRKREHELVYARFSPRKKRTITAIVSCCALLPLFVSGSFIPSIPQISHDLHSRPEVISMAVSLSIGAGAIGVSTWGSYSTFYGRRVIYLLSLPLLVIGSVGVAFSHDVSALMIWRFIQAFGSAVGWSNGSAVIGDIYKLEERGRATGIFFAVMLLGPAIAPLAGGVATKYASWRVMQLFLGALGLLAFIVILALLPETSHPGVLGIDKYNAKAEAKGSKARQFVLVNPLNSFALLRSPNVMAATLAGWVVLLTDYTLLIPINQTIGERYNIHNSAVIGACFLPEGLGNLIGAPVAGWISDRIIIRSRQRRKAELEQANFISSETPERSTSTSGDRTWVPEDRLRATLAGALLFVPLSVLFSGIFVTYVPGTTGLVLNLICFFLNGLGVDFVTSPATAYGVDILHDRSAEVVAAMLAFRSILLAFATSAIIPLIDRIGALAVDAIAAALAWVGFIILWFTIRYGDRMRAAVDMGYSSTETN